VASVLSPQFCLNGSVKSVVLSEIAFEPWMIGKAGGNAALNFCFPVFLIETFLLDWVGVAALIESADPCGITICEMAVFHASPSLQNPGKVCKIRTTGEQIWCRGSPPSILVIRWKHQPQEIVAGRIGAARPDDTD